MIIASTSHPFNIVDRARFKWTGRLAVEVNIENEIFAVVYSIWKFHVVICQTLSKNCAEVHAYYFNFFVQPIRSLFSGVVFAVAVFLA